MGATLPTPDPPPDRATAHLSRGLRPALRGEHARGDPRDVRGRARPDRAARADRRRSSSGPPARRSPASSRSLLEPPTPAAAIEPGARWRPSPPPRDRRRSTPAAEPRRDPPATDASALLRRVRLGPDVARLPGRSGPASCRRAPATRPTSSRSILGIFLIGIALGATIFAIVRPRIRNADRCSSPSPSSSSRAVAIAGLVLVDRPARRARSRRRPLETALAILLPDRPRRPAGHVRHGLQFPAVSTLLGDDPAQIARTPAGSSRRTRPARSSRPSSIPFFVIPAIGSPRAVAVLALSTSRSASPCRGRDATPRGRCRGSRRPPASAVVAVGDRRVALSPGTAIVDPSVARIQAANGDDLRSPRRTRSRRSRPARRRRPAALGHRHGDDPADGRRQADADPAADAPAAVDRRRLTVAFGMGSAFRGGADRRAQDRGGRARPVGARRCSATSTRTPPTVLANPNGQRHRHRRPEPPRADDRALRHHRHRPAAADRELRRVRHLVARVLPGRPRPPEPGRGDDAVDPVRRARSTSSRPTSGRSSAVFPHVDRRVRAGRLRASS